MYKNKWTALSVAAVVLAAVTTMWAQDVRVSGRISGGGSAFLTSNDLVLAPVILDPDGIRISHGFQLNCQQHGEEGAPIPGPNNLQVSVHVPDGPDQKFQLTSLQFSQCFSTFTEGDFTETADPGAGNGDFYWYQGRGTGRWNGVDGYCADWIFTDEGEAGTDDRIIGLRIWSDCANGTGFVLSVGDFNPDDTFNFGGGRTLAFGNHQTHIVTGKGRNPK